MNLTLAIIKPDAFTRALTGQILAHLEGDGFRIRAARVILLTEPQARQFYDVHRERPFFQPLVRFMTSGPCMALVLERDDAVARLRRAIGGTDPAQAEPGSVRARFAESKERNAIHASDSDDNARHEIAFFFAASDLLSTAGPPRSDRASEN